MAPIFAAWVMACVKDRSKGEGIGMLRVDLLILERQDVVLEREGLPSSMGVKLEDGLFPGPLVVHAEISKSGESFLAQGWAKGRMRSICDRCLIGIEGPFQSSFVVHYRQAAGEVMDHEEKEKELSGEDTDTVLFNGKEIDLSDEVRQSVMLALPMRALCREDCRGLCAGCGADLNRESCRCPDPPRDSRWEALKGFKPRNGS